MLEAFFFLYQTKGTCTDKRRRTTPHAQVTDEAADTQPKCAPKDGLIGTMVRDALLELQKGVYQR